jgi:hypothetical protein
MLGAPAVVFDAAEGDALDVLDALLWGKRPPSPEELEALDVVRPQLMEVAAARIVRRSLRFLTHGGGWRRRGVLRGGERRHGRIFDAALNEGFDFSFTEASESLFVGASRVLLPLSRQSRRNMMQGGDERHGRRVVRDVVVRAGTRPGDWIFLALAEAGLTRFGLGPAAHDALRSRLRQASPLAALLELDAGGEVAAVAERFELLLAPDAVRLVECLDDALFERWRSALQQRIQPAGDAASYQRRWSEAHLALSTWILLVDQERRLDLLRPVLDLLAWLVREGLRFSGEDPRAGLRRRANARTIEEGDRALEAIASVTELVASLAELRSRLGEERYGDPRYEEGQLFLADFDARLQPTVDDAAQLTRTLRGAIG